jgi:hypothetical protein
MNYLGNLYLFTAGNSLAELVSLFQNIDRKQINLEI